MLWSRCIQCFFYIPTIRGTGKPGDVIRGKGGGGRKSPSGVQGHSPWWRVRGQSRPKRGSGGGCDLDSRVWVCQCHWKCHSSLERIGLHTDVLVISVENRKFFPPRIFNAPLKGFPLELGVGQGVKKLVMALPDDHKSSKIGLAVQTEYRHVTDSHLSTAKTALSHSVARVKTETSPICLAKMD